MAKTTTAVSRAPCAKQRCGRLAQWGWTKYPYLEFGADYPATYGIYSETPDFMPDWQNRSRDVCYMVGCNAWGQASLSQLLPSQLHSWAIETCPKQSSAPQTFLNPSFLSTLIGKAYGRSDTAFDNSTARNRSFTVLSGVLMRSHQNNSCSWLNPVGSHQLKSAER